MKVVEKATVAPSGMPKRVLVCSCGWSSVRYDENGATRERIEESHWRHHLRINASQETHA